MQVPTSAELLSEESSRLGTNGRLPGLNPGSLSGRSMLSSKPILGGRHADPRSRLGTPEPGPRCGSKRTNRAKI